MLDENQIIGIVLAIIGILFIFIGIVLFMDAALIAMGNVLFLIGVALTIGFQKMLSLFTRRDRIPGTICFILGIALVLFRWGIIGILVEVFGFINLFGNFFPVLLFSARQMPYIGPILRYPIFDKIADLIAGKGLMAEHSKSRV